MRHVITKKSPNRQYVTLAAAFDFFNRRLFQGALPPLLITLQRHKGARGYYSAGRFQGRASPEDSTDELALNPAEFKGRTDAEILSTLVHEMAHHWQQHEGSPSRNRYHNREWADQMEALGLMPSSTGQPGGKRTGQKVSHYILGGGPFDRACGQLLAGGTRVEWQSLECNHEKPRNSKVKYTCPVCGLNAWAKPDVHLECGECGERLEPEPDGPR
jgi:predicted SprT family Zn-dependent metalloprotease